MHGFRHIRHMHCRPMGSGVASRPSRPSHPQPHFTAFCRHRNIGRLKAFNAYAQQAGDDALDAVAPCIGESIQSPRPTLPRAMAERGSELAIGRAGGEFGRVTASSAMASWRPERNAVLTALYGGPTRRCITPKPPAEIKSFLTLLTDLRLNGASRNPVCT